MRPTLLLLFSFLSLSSLSAATIRFDPPAPDSRSYVRATTWAPCAQVTEVIVNGRVITVQMQGGCAIATFTSTPVTANLGVLSGGEYEIIFMLGALEVGRTQLIVRGVDPFRARPYGGPIAGGNRVGFAVEDDSFDDPVSVTFGDAAASRVSRGTEGVLVDAPPHAPGTVDVTIKMRRFGTDEEITLASRAAYTYYDPSSPPDPFVFEPILFPLALDAPGAYGSEWRTDNFLRPMGYLAFFRTPPCGTCTTEVVNRRVAMDLRGPAGIRLDLVRGSLSDLATSSRIRDVSRSGENAGTEIRVVRDSAFRGRIEFLDIPIDPRYRYSLRVWSLTSSASVDVEWTSPASFGVTRIDLQGGDRDLHFGMADLTNGFAGFPAGDRARMAIAQRCLDSKLWAILSITNNETQQVTIVSPQ